MSFFKSLLLIFIIWFFGFVAFVSNIHFSKDEISEEADAIIVLTGAKGRLDAGFDLLIAKKAKQLFISGVGKDTSLNDLLSKLSNIDQKKLNRENIFIGHMASSTQENAIETENWVKENNIRSIILVTSNYHMIRSLLEMERLMPDVKIIPYQVVKNIGFWKNLDNLKLILLEYHKFIFSYLTRII